MRIKRKVSFSLHIRKGTEGPYPIRMRITWSGNRVDIPMTYRLNTDDFNGGLATGKGSREINSCILKWEGIAEDIFSFFEHVEKRIPSKDEFRNLFNERTGRGVKKEIEKQDFFSVFDKFFDTESVNNSWSNQTIKKFTTIKNHLLKYDKNLDLSSLTDKDLQGFVRYLMKKDLRNTTINKHLAFVRWFLRWAERKGYYKGNLHNDYRPKFKGTNGDNKEVIHLSWDELMHLYELEFTENKKYLERVRDVFCFCCFTSLRYSDAYNLKKSDIQNDTISIVAQKTSESLRIELNRYSRAILEKYKDIPLENGKALPVISNQKMNVYLKELGRVAELNEPIRIVYFKGSTRHEEVFPKHSLLTTHCGRRTFIVNALYLGIPAEVVMKWTGHADYEAMKPYIKIVDQLKKREMGKFDEA